MFALPEQIVLVFEDGNIKVSNKEEQEMNK